ncbi:MAG TPA: DUF488 domain-containing protein [Candidatus Acidoferrum sp.]|nr:DUF488 domain-containing protein [Candidatus Acidoferrum sp.]
MTSGETKAARAGRKHVARARNQYAGACPDGTAENVAAERSDAAARNLADAKIAVGANVAAKLTVFTIGHSTRAIEEFIALLAAHGVARLVDVRSIPKSRRVPQFNSDALAASLRKEGIEYIHMQSLGGRRHAKKDSVNLGWRNVSFRGYADYMASEEFRTALAHLLELAREKRTAIMCAEAVPWRCHRSLIGDALLVRGAHVQDIMSVTSVKAHALTPFAKVEGLNVVYPAGFEQGKLQLS